MSSANRLVLIFILGLAYFDDTFASQTDLKAIVTQIMQTCSDILGLKRETLSSWRSLGDVETADIHLRQLMVGGVAHLPVNDVMIQALEAEDKSNLLREVGRIIQEEFPNWKFKQGQMFGVGFNTSLPERGFNWHYDLKEGTPPADLRKIQSGEIPEFRLRATIQTHPAHDAPTVTIPQLGPYRGRSIQAFDSRVTFFIVETTRHATPMRPTAEDRFVWIMEWTVQLSD